MRASNGFTIKLAYDEFNRTSNVKYQIGSDALNTQWRYGNASVVYGVKYNGVEKISYDYDSLMRRTSTTINTTVPFTTNYGYKSVGNSASTQLASIWYSNTEAFNYTYDANGNITAITHPAGYELVHYYYDALNQLIREDNFELNKSVAYTYDNGGNIRSVKEYAYTTGNLGSVVNEKVYSYGDTEWKDLLTNYNGVNISYDAIGNPTNWINGESFSWVDGRQLAAVTKGSNTFNYAYNEDGIRTSKTINGIRTDYYLNGTSIIMQKTGDNCIWYTYDENGFATGFRYNGNEYYYFRNGQNDIIGVIDSSGSTVARYTYDSWGNHVSITDGNGNNVANNLNHIANINPFRYKGYYYDTETGLYYVSSRYYDPEIGRWINADGYVSTGQGVLGNNMFVYCGNNPIVRLDLTGARYCAATSISKERSYERRYACYWQKQVTLEKYNPKPIGRYAKGNVYLVTDPNEILTNFSNDVIVVDNRGPKPDDNVEIRHSFLITNQELKREILTLLYNYEQENPTGWNRTVDSMMIEWDIHNVGAFIGNYVPFCGKLYSRSIHVCFDNNSEGWSKWDHFIDGARKIFG